MMMVPPVSQPAFSVEDKKTFVQYLGMVSKVGQIVKFYIFTVQLPLTLGSIWIKAPVLAQWPLEGW